VKFDSEQLLTIFPIRSISSYSRKAITICIFLLFKKKWAKRTLIAHFLLLEIAIMKKLMQIIIFLSWISSLVWAGLELEKIEFFHSLCAAL